MIRRRAWRCSMPMASTPRCCFPIRRADRSSNLGDVDYELDVVRAYNDTLAEWKRVSDRYVPLAIVPYLSAPAVIKTRARTRRGGGPSRR